MAKQDNKSEKGSQTPNMVAAPMFAALIGGGTAAGVLFGFFGAAAIVTAAWPAALIIAGAALFFGGIAFLVQYDKGLKTELAASKSAAEEAEEAVEAEEAAAATAKQQLEVQVSGLQTDLAAAKAEAAATAKEAATKLERLSTVIARVETAAQAAATEKQQLEAQVSGLQTELAAANSAAEAAEAVAKSEKEAAATAATEKQQLEAQVGGLQTDLAAAEAAAEAAVEAVEAVAAKQQLKDKVSYLQTELAAAKSAAEAEAATYGLYFQEGAKLSQSDIDIKEVEKMVAEKLRTEYEDTVECLRRELADSEVRHELGAQEATTELAGRDRDIGELKEVISLLEQNISSLRGASVATTWRGVVQSAQYEQALSEVEESRTKGVEAAEMKAQEAGQKANARSAATLFQTSVRTAQLLSAQEENGKLADRLDNLKDEAELQHGELNDVYGVYSEAEIANVALRQEVSTLQDLLKQEKAKNVDPSELDDAAGPQAQQMSC